MGFFDNLFGKKKESVTITPIELKDWLHKNSDEFLSEMTQRVDDNINKIEAEKEKLRKELKRLSGRSLNQKNISDKEKQLIRGNRESYIKKTYDFLEKIDVDGKNLEDMEEFCNDFESKLKEFNNNSSRAYYILNNFFDMRDIAISIKNIERNVLELLNLTKNPQLRKYKSIVSKVRELNELLVNSDKIISESYDIQEEMEEIEDKIEKLESKISSIKESEKFSDFKKAEKKLKTYDTKIRKLSSKVNNKIKKIDKELRKYMHSTIKKDLIEEYLDNPLQALEKDEDLEFLKVLEKLKKNIKKRDIDTKDEDKTFSRIDDLDEKFFTKIRSKHRKLKDKLSFNRQRVDKASVMMDYKELQYQKEHLEDKLKRLSSELKEKKSTVENYDIPRKIERLENEISQFTGYDISIDFPDEDQ